jgi:predicted NBD/HSP70 family sugar kinase
VTQPAKESIDKMCIALGRGLHMIATALAPTEIVVVGDITPLWYLVGPLVEAEMRRNPLVRVPRLRPAHEGNKARLRSAVALVMHENLIQNETADGSYPPADADYCTSSAHA